MLSQAEYEHLCDLQDAQERVEEDLAEDTTYYISALNMLSKNDRERAGELLLLIFDKDSQEHKEILDLLYKGIQIFAKDLIEERAKIARRWGAR